MADSDEVPPLEDMSELLEQAHKIHGNQMSNTGTTTSKPTATDTSHQTHVAPQQNSGTNKAECTGAKKQNAAPKPTTSTSSSSFGGMKKGFLFGSSSKPKSAKKAPAVKSSTSSTDSTQDIPLIKPKTAEGEGDRKHEIAEVQEALKASTPLLQNTEWVTDDLLKNIEKNPRLLKQLSDPRISQAMTKFQRNPQLAMQEYQNNPEIQQFFKEFSGILGTHFESLGANNPPQSPPTQTIRTQDNSNGADISVHSSTNPKQATATDEARMKEILSDPKMQQILRDEEIQRLFTVLRTSPDEAQRMLQQLGPSGKEKVQRLVDAGLLGFSSR
ncbi:uncharacterized protein [Amphiura filiformis]|uniref:uncharacterized protein n=1 Tax=Amphiura filiformis TaxID=82378 RepID=UPI003B21C138